MCEDIFGCDHKPTIPIIDDDTHEIVQWRCQCGQTTKQVEAEPKAKAP